MKIEVHLLSHDDEQMLDWSLRYYLACTDVVIVHDGGPRGDSIRIAKISFRREMESRLVFTPWDTGGELNDELAMRLKNECWRGTDADWVIVADMDELIWSSVGFRARLEKAQEQGAAVLRPNGFEMFSDQWFEPGEHSGQITDLAKDGSPDDEWYAKPVVFSPRLVAETGFGIGAHEARPVLRDGRGLVVDRKWPCCGDLALLHYKSIFGGLERIAARYDATRTRLARVNVRNGWGNIHDAGMVHAQKKRDLLLPGVRRVVT